MLTSKTKKKAAATGSGGELRRHNDSNFRAEPKCLAADPIGLTAWWARHSAAEIENLRLNVNSLRRQQRWSLLHASWLLLFCYAPTLVSTVVASDRCVVTTTVAIVVATVVVTMTTIKNRIGEGGATAAARRLGPETATSAVRATLPAAAAIAATTGESKKHSVGEPSRSGLGRHRRSVALRCLLTKGNRRPAA